MLHVFYYTIPMYSVLTDYEDETLNLAISQYFFSRGEHKVIVAPHGNSQSGQPFIRTMTSVMSKLRGEAKQKTPKRALQFVYNEVGGVIEASSAGSLPRNRQQAKDMRRNNPSKQERDPRRRRKVL